VRAMAKPAIPNQSSYGVLSQLGLGGVGSLVPTFTSTTGNSPYQDPYETIRKLQTALAEERKARETAEQNNKLLVESTVKDALTDLPNRAAFDVMLDIQFQQRARTSEEIHYALLDLDNFKPVNDNLGHLAGDDLLRMFAQKMKDRFRIGTGDFLARTGGDEFSIVFTNSLDPKIIKHRLTQLQKEAPDWEVETFDKTGSAVTVKFGGFSFGLASTTEKEKKIESSKALISEADRLMYIDKDREGKIHIPRACAAPTGNILNPA